MRVLVPYLELSAKGYSGIAGVHHQRGLKKESTEQHGIVRKRKVAQGTPIYAHKDCTIVFRTTIAIR